MDNVSFITKISPVSGEEVEFAIINRGNEEFTSMLKSTYDEMIARETPTL